MAAPVAKWTLGALVDHAEELFDGPLERSGNLERDHCRRNEDAVLDRVDGLAADPDASRKLRLRPAAKLPFGAQTIGEPLSQAGAPAALAPRS